MSNLRPILIILIICKCASYTSQQEHDPAFMANYAKIQEDCAKENHVDVGEMIKARKENRIPNVPGIKCYFKCVNVKLGIIDATGDVVDAVLKQVANELVDDALEREIVEECGPIKGADLCETAYQLMVCITKAKLD